MLMLVCHLSLVENVIFYFRYSHQLSIMIYHPEIVTDCRNIFSSVASAVIYQIANNKTKYFRNFTKFLNYNLQLDISTIRPGPGDYDLNSLLIMTVTITIINWRNSLLLFVSISCSQSEVKPVLSLILSQMTA